MSNILIRVSTSRILGSGHIARCLRLAEELTTFGKKIIFATNFEGEIYLKRTSEFDDIIKVKTQGINRHHFSDIKAKKWLGNKEEEDARACLSGLKERGIKNLEWIIADHYGIGLEWEIAVAREFRKSKILVIDDLADRSHKANILIDQNYWKHDRYAIYRELVNQDCKILIGAKFALIKKITTDIRNDIREREKKRVMVYFGGSDTKGANMCIEVAREKEFRNIIFDIILGQNIKDEQATAAIKNKGVNTNIYRNLKSLEEVMVKADIAIGAGGSTNWERISIGLPTIVASTSDDQVEIAKNLHNEEAIYYLGPISEITTWDIKNTLLKYIKGKINIRKKIELCDGLGIQRVLAHMQYYSDIIEREVEMKDKKQLIEWRNEEEVRYNSFRKEKIEERDHEKWLKAGLKNKRRIQLIFEYKKNSLPVGQIRFDISETNDVEIDISIEKGLRGLGIGKIILGKGCQHVINKWGHGIRFLAKVKHNNEASKKLFKSLGFKTMSDHPSREYNTLVMEVTHH